MSWFLESSGSPEAKCEFKVVHRNLTARATSQASWHCVDFFFFFSKVIFFFSYEGFHSLTLYTANFQLGSISQSYVDTCCVKGQVHIKCFPVETLTITCIDTLRRNLINHKLFIINVECCLTKSADLSFNIHTCSFDGVIQPAPITLFVHSLQVA